MNPTNANQLDELDQPVKQFLTTNFTEHCELGETTNSKNPTTLLAIFSDDLNSFTIKFLTHH